jgi:LPS export ABC transporter protein LptC
MSLIACFIGAGVLLVRTQQGERASSLQGSISEHTPPNVPPRSRVVLQDFQRSETKDGKKLWEMSAQRGEFFPDDNVVNLFNAVLHIFRDNEDTVTLRAPEAVVSLKGTSLLQAKGMGGVIITQGDSLTMETQEAIYDKQQEKVTSEEEVTFKGKASTTVGVGLEADMKSQVFLLKENVRSVFLQHEGSTAKLPLGGKGK